MRRRAPTRKRLLSAALALGAHVLALLALGWRTPRVGEPSAGPEEHPLQLSIVRPPRPASASASGATVRAPATLPADIAAPEAPLAASPPGSGPRGVEQGPRDCAPEDLILLTEAEKARCRNELDADKARRAAQGADQRLAKQVAGLKAVPRIESIPAEKRAYYDAVAAAYEQQNHGPPMAGRLPGISCGPKTPYHSLKLGPLPCAITPPQGFLTEEAGIPPP